MLVIVPEGTIMEDLIIEIATKLAIENNDYFDDLEDLEKEYYIKKAKLYLDLINIDDLC